MRNKSGFLLSLIVTFLEFILLNSFDLTGDYALKYSLLLLFNIVYQTILIKKTLGLCTFTYLFVVFLYLFHFGEIIMLGFFPWYEYDYVDYFSTYMLREPETAKRTLDLCINATNFFVTGALFYKKRVSYLVMHEGLNVQTIAKFIFYPLFAVRVLLDALQIFVAYTLGYHGTFTTGIGGVFSALAMMAYGAIPLYYLSIEDRQAKKRFLVFIVCYLMCTMLTGNRGHQVTCLLGLFIIYITQNPVTIKQTVLYMIVAILGLQFLDVIIAMRGYGIAYFFDHFSEFTEMTLQTNILLETIGTFGETIFTPFLVLQEYDRLQPFFGETFVKSFASIIPDVFGGLKDINNEAVLGRALNTDFTIGGSLLGEMYYNFGEFYPIPTMLVGYIYAKMSDKVRYFVSNNRIIEVIFVLPVCVILIWWVRDSIGNMTRQIVWFAILATIGIKMFKRNTL